MKTIEHVTLIGAGGTGSMILPAIVPVYDVTIWDGDDYEEKNVTRQIFSANNIGGNKAETLASVFNNGHKTVDAQPFMVKGDEVLNTDIIICCVDNNDGRLAAENLADTHSVPLIICANEKWEPMSWLYLPEFKYTNRNPYKRHNLGHLTEGRQLTCAGVEIIDQNVQMPSANYCAGSHALHIIESLRTCKKPENYLAEITSVPWPIFKTMKEIEP